MATSLIQNAGKGNHRQCTVCNVSRPHAEFKGSNSICSSCVSKGYASNGGTSQGPRGAGYDVHFPMYGPKGSGGGDSGPKKTPRKGKPYNPTAPAFGNDSSSYDDSGDFN